MIYPIENDTYLGKNYNVEYFMANGKVATFNADMVNLDKTYFYFEDEDGGLIMIRQEDVRSIQCRPAEHQDKIFRHSEDYDKGYKLGRQDGEDFGFNKALKVMRDWMTIHFGGNQGVTALDEVYQQLIDLEIPMEVGD